VVTTGQLQAWGVGRSTTARRVSDGAWQRLHRGVVVLHSGPVTWRQEARGALLYAGAGAALSHRSAAYVHGMVPSPGPEVVVSVDARRAVAPQPGLVVHRRAPMPFAGGRLRVVGEDETVLDVVDQLGSDDDLVGFVCDAMRQGILPGRVLLHAGRRPRLRRRSLLEDLLCAPDDGVESPLEWRYLRDVERRHHLPPGRAQVRQRVGGRWIRADRIYPGRGVRVELDGRLAHPLGATDDDVWRDNAVLVERADLTLRYRWRHVVGDPCATAGQVAHALQRGGWRGRPRPCSPTCTAGKPATGR
jgi:hypothetical protein